MTRERIELHGGRWDGETREVLPTAQVVSFSMEHDGQTLYGQYTRSEWRRDGVAMFVWQGWH